MCVCVCVPAQKTVLIVYAHQSGGSFNSAAKDVAVETLRQQGYKVVVSDLYAMNFRASATMEDITGTHTHTHAHTHTHTHVPNKLHTRLTLLLFCLFAR